MTGRGVDARQALHAVAEHLLAGPQYRAAGRIRLAVTETGFETTTPPGNGLERVEVRGAEVLAYPGGAAVPIAGTTRAMAAVLGVEPGPPAGLYHDHAALGPDDELHADPAAVEVILRALAAGAQALRDLSAGEEEPVLWPEHFDVAITLGEVNYGLSAGDAGHDAPYAYVGPWTPREGEFWNEPFGASRPTADLAGPAGVLAFFREGRERAGD